MDSSSDVIIVGGGLIGCAIALRLAQRRMQVRVFDRGEPGCEASSAGAGMIAPQGETLRPDAFYDLCAASRDLYPGFVTEVEELSGCSVDFRKGGSLRVAFDEAESRDLDEIYETQTGRGLSIEKLSGEEARRRLPQVSPRVIKGLFLASDYWLNNESLVSALHKACRAVGVVFHTHSPVARFSAVGERIESISVQSGSRQAPVAYPAGSFVLAAGAWSGELAASLDVRLPMEPCRGQMLELEGAQDFSCPLRAGHFYCVPRSGGKLIAGSTMEYSGFQKSVTAEGLLSILEGVRRLAPGTANLRFCRAWAGLRPDTADHLPILGYGAWDNLIFATGHFRNGILLTPITARLVAELFAAGSASFSLEPYSPLRFQPSLGDSRT